MDHSRPQHAVPPLRIGFAGTPPFAATALSALLHAGHTIPLVLTQPDRPKGRGMALAASAVKTLAVAHGLPVLQPATLKTAEARAPLFAVPLDVLVVAAYGLILPPEVLAWPRHGCLNIHASLLPRWRGAAPIARAIEAGDTQTGVTIMQMDAGLDTGAMITTNPVPIADDDTAATLHDRLAHAGAAAIVAALATLARDGALHGTAQPAAGATYARKVERDEARIDWTLPAALQALRVRAFDPAPVAWTTVGGAALKVWRARAEASSTSTPGVVLAADAAGLVVACGEGALRVTELQPAGARRMDVAAFLAGAGRAVKPGTILGGDAAAATPTATLHGAHPQ